MRSRFNRGIILLVVFAITMIFARDMLPIVRSQASGAMRVQSAAQYADGTLVIHVSMPPTTMIERAQIETESGNIPLDAELITSDLVYWLVLDVSQNMVNIGSSIQNDLVDLVRALNDDAALGIVRYDEQIKVFPATSDLIEAEAMLDEYDPQYIATACIYDALATLAEMQPITPHVWRVLVVSGGMTEQVDCRQGDFDDFGVPIDIIVVSNHTSSVLENVAGESGGLYLESNRRNFPANFDEIEAIWSQQIYRLTSVSNQATIRAGELSLQVGGDDVFALPLAIAAFTDIMPDGSPYIPPTAIPTATATYTLTPTPTFTDTATATATDTPSLTPTLTHTATVTFTATTTATSTFTLTPTITTTASETTIPPTESDTVTPITPTDADTSTATETPSVALVPTEAASQVTVEVVEVTDEPTATAIETEVTVEVVEVTDEPTATETDPIGAAVGSDATEILPTDAPPTDNPSPEAAQSEIVPESPQAEVTSEVVVPDSESANFVNRVIILGGVALVVVIIGVIYGLLRNTDEEMALATSQNGLNTPVIAPLLDETSENFYKVDKTAPEVPVQAKPAPKSKKIDHTDLTGIEEVIEAIDEDDDGTRIWAIDELQEVIRIPAVAMLLRDANDTGYDIINPTSVLGSASECEIILRGDAGVAHQHLRFDIDAENKVRVTPLTDHPVFVNGTRLIDTLQLQTADVIQVSPETQLTFYYIEDDFA